jgi:hypothetical protein
MKYYTIDTNIREIAMIIIINFANKPLVTEQLQKTSNLRIVPTVP